MLVRELARGGASTSRSGGSTGSSGSSSKGRGSANANISGRNCGVLCPLAHLCVGSKKKPARFGEKWEKRKTVPGNFAIASDTSATGLPGN